MGEKGAVHKIDFMLVEWDIVAEGARQKIWSDGERRVRLLELDERFVETEWCEKTHVGMVLEGLVEIDFRGTVERFAAGQGMTIRMGEGHKAKPIGGIARIVFFE
jgi:hypothetical protein